MALPVVDFADFVDGPDSSRKAIGQRLVASFKKHGFVKLINHEIPESVVKDLSEWSVKFFDLKSSVKAKCINTESLDPPRGWLVDEKTSALYSKNLEIAPKEQLSDEKESFDWTSADDSLYPNRWLDEEDLPGFKDFMEAFYDISLKAALSVVEACEIGLELPPGSLTQKCIPSARNASEARILHYPAVSIEKLKTGLSRRIWPHTDFGVITVLFQDHAGGLELEDRSHLGTFIPVPKEHPNEMVINVGDTFERWTNGLLPAGLHQVSAPTEYKQLKTGELPVRYSSVFFLKANRDVSVGSLPQFIKPQSPAGYSDITAHQFQMERLGPLGRKSRG